MTLYTEGKKWLDIFPNQTRYKPCDSEPSQFTRVSLLGRWNDILKLSTYTFLYHTSRYFSLLLSSRYSDPVTSTFCLIVIWSSAYKLVVKLLCSRYFFFKARI